MIEVRGLTKSYGNSPAPMHEVGADARGPRHPGRPFGALCGWVAVTIVAAAILLHHRDV